MLESFLDLLDSPILLLSEKTSLPGDQIKLLLVLLSCIPLGLTHKLIKDPIGRNLYSFIPGIFFQIFLFRSGVFRTILNSIFLYVVMLICPRKQCGIIVFLASLATLSYIHIERMIVGISFDSFN